MHNPSMATLDDDVHEVTRDEGMATGRDVDGQRIDLSMERHNNRIVANIKNMYRTENNLFRCYVSP